jgi:hypothetical protein
MAAATTKPVAAKLVIPLLLGLGLGESVPAAKTT